MSITIRKAASGDSAAVCRMLSDIGNLHYTARPDIFNESTQKYSKTEFISLISDTNRPVFVACDGEKVIGYIFCILKQISGHSVLCDRKILYIDDLYVMPSSREEGVGRMLMDTAEKYAADNSCADVELNVWNFHGGAMSFYEKCGYCVQRYTMEKKIH